MKSHFDKLDDLVDETRAAEQRLAGLEQDTRQPRLTMEADMPSDTKTRNRTEDIEADRVISGNRSSANQVDPDQMCPTSFGHDFTGPPALPCLRDDAMVDNGAAAPKPCLSPVEMCTLTAAGGLLPVGKASTAMRIVYYQPRLRFCPTKKTNSGRTSIQYALYYSSFGWINNQLAVPFWWRVIETKSRQVLVFDPYGSTVVSAPVRLRELGARYVVGSFSLGRWMWLERFFWQNEDLGISFSGVKYKQFDPLRSIAVFFAARLV